MLPFSIRHPLIFYRGLRGFANQDLTPRLKLIMADFIIKSKIAKTVPWKKTAATAAGLPVEIPLAFDMFPLYTETYCCFGGSAGVTQAPIEHAESMGFSRDLCSYMKASIGALELNYPCDYGAGLVPDVYLGWNAVCDTHVKWFENEARRHGVGSFSLDIPSAVAGRTDAELEADIDYVVTQFHDCFAYLEALTGKKFDEDKFMGIIAKSQEACELYRRLYEYRKRFPAHQYFQRQRLFMLPVAVMWNLDGCIKYYRKELARLEAAYGKLSPEQEQKGREKYRLGWEGITIWYNVDLYYELMARGACFVYETYTEALGMRKKKTHTFDETLRQMAREVLIGTYTLNLERRIAHWEQTIDAFNLDGVVLHANMSCRPSATALVDLKEALQKSRGIPVLILYGDMADPRAWADGPNQSRLDSFIEIMEEKKKDSLEEITK